MITKAVKLIVNMLFRFMCLQFANIMKKNSMKNLKRNNKDTLCFLMNNAQIK